MILLHSWNILPETLISYRLKINQRHRSVAINQLLSKAEWSGWAGLCGQALSQGVVHPISINRSVPFL